ncbi:MAG: rod shape-determining protein MreD [Candidatus Omnitrophota bacterium]|nr:rod shape-determining protein MreD [Candidatus Omnitrophota bacterium]
MHNKISRFSLYLSLIAAFLIQLLFLDYVKIAQVKPDLMALLVIFFSIFFGPGIGLEAGFAAGLFKDIYSLDIFGVNTLTLSLTGLAAGIVSPKFFRESKLTQTMLVFIFSALYMTIHCFAALLILKITYTNLPEYLFGLILPSSLYTTVISFFIFPILINRYRLKKNEEYL